MQGLQALQLSRCHTRVFCIGHWLNKANRLCIALQLAGSDMIYCMAVSVGLGDVLTSQPVRYLVFGTCAAL